MYRNVKLFYAVEDDVSHIYINEYSFFQGKKVLNKRNTFVLVFKISVSEQYMKDLNFLNIKIKQ